MFINKRALIFLCLFVALVISSSGAYAEEIFVPEILTTVYNESIGPYFELFFDDSDIAESMSMLMEVDYWTEADGTIYYANYNHTFFLYFEADSKWDSAKNVMAYADTSDDSMIKNLPLFPFVHTLASLDSSCDPVEILEWYNAATDGDIFATENFIAVYTKGPDNSAVLGLYPV